MKQIKQSATFFSQHSEWLAQFDCTTLLLNLLDLYESAGVYIVDKNQQVLYWSLGLEKLSGLRQEDVVGKTCLPECTIIDASSDKTQLIKLSQADGSKIGLNKNAQVLFDRTGTFATFFGSIMANTRINPFRLVI
jgi:PAS domain-containing protein